MKVGAFLEQGVLAGGGYQQSLNALLQIREVCGDLAEIEVFTTERANVAPLRELGFIPVVVRIGFFDRLMALPATSPMAMRLQRVLRLVSPFEKLLLKRGVSLVYFLSPSWRALCLQSLNYIFTVWDLCHRDFPEFPEVRSNGEFETREQLFRAALPKAMLVVCDSPQLAANICRWYAVDPVRTLPMPFQPALAVGAEAGAGAAPPAAAGRRYLLYPAQFWSHKNHVALVRAMQLLRDGGVDDVQLVLTGSDKGGAARVKAEVQRCGLEDRVTFEGFVADATLRELYRGALALVMPTYFGPTNLPPLEAWSLGVPVIYPQHLSGQAGDAAQLFDVDDPASLAEALRVVATDAARRAELIRLGHQRLRYFAERRADAAQQLRRAVVAFGQRSAGFSAPQA